MVRYSTVEREREVVGPALKVSVSEDAGRGEIDIHIEGQLVLTLNQRGAVRLWKIEPIEGLALTEEGYIQVEDG
jgi:hypothetical protein